MKALIVGIDGCSWSIIRRLKCTEVLSTKFIQGNTAYGILESTTPPWSIPAWNSLFTGVRPKKLGIYSFVKRCGSKLAPISKELDEQVYLWDLVSMYDGKVIAVNIPCVSKAVPVNGYFIAGFLANRKKLAYPCTLNEKLLQHKYIVDVIDVHPLTDEEYLETCIKTTIQRTALFLSLAKKVNWSLGIVVYTCSDRIQHRFLKTRFSFVEKYYEVLDRCIAKLLDSVNIDDNTIVFMVSDHGFKIPKATISVNTWLASRGYLDVNVLPTRRRITKIAKYALSNNMLLLTIARKIIFKVPITSIFVSQKQRAAANDIVETYRGAYMPSEDGAIYVSEMRESLREIIVKRIAENIINEIPGIKVYKPRQEPKRNNPDLILESEEWAFSVDPYLPLKLKTIRATHSKHGIFAALGSRNVVKPGFRGTLQIYDVLPTILYCMDIPIASYIDGNIRTEIFEESFLKHRTPRYVSLSYTRARMKMNLRRSLIFRQKL